MEPPERKAFPTEEEDFADDDRVSYSRKVEKYVLEEPSTNEEFEWLARYKTWIPVQPDEAQIRQQASIYAIPGVDENEPAFDPRKAKRKAAAAALERAESNKEKKAKRAPIPTAVYATGIPLDATTDEIASVFDRFGVIAESLDTDEKRIYMYSDTEGKFKGDALIESVTNAIQMLDDSDFRLGKKDPNGPMRVQVADPSHRAQKDNVGSGDEARDKNSDAFRDRAKAKRKREELNARISNWEEDDERSIPRPSRTSRYDKIVVLKHMFTPEEADDVAEMADIQTELREEAEKHGEVERIVMFDREADGVVMLHFSTDLAAKACVSSFHGRMFDGRTVQAYRATGTERFKKTQWLDGAKGDGDDVGDDEGARLEAANGGKDFRIVVSTGTLSNFLIHEVSRDQVVMKAFLSSLERTTTAAIFLFSHDAEAAAAFRASILLSTGHPNPTAAGSNFNSASVCFFISSREDRQSHCVKLI
nr:splicing factor u2af-associated protein 2 [Quercus suber]